MQTWASRATARRRSRIENPHVAQRHPAIEEAKCSAPSFRPAGRRRFPGPLLAIPVTLALAVSCSTSAVATKSDARLHSAARRRLERLDATLVSRLRAGQPPGISAAIVFADGSTWSGSAGTADAEHHRPVTTSTAFSIASISKTFVAAAALRVAAHGAVDLDAPIARWVPQVIRADAVTLRHLLSHTSGLGDPGAQRVCDPGTCFNYADSNYEIAADVIERATGEPLTELVRRQFLEPLGLSRTWFQQTDAARAPLAAAHHGRQPVPNAHPFAHFGYSGSGAATALDLARWGRALYGGHALTERSVAEMLDTERTADLPCVPRGRCGSPYGIGTESLSFAGWRAYGHAGSTGTLLAYFPRQRITIAVLTNGVPGGPQDPFTTAEILAAATPGIAAAPHIWSVRRSGHGGRRRIADRGDAIAPAASPLAGDLAYASAPRNRTRDIVVSALDGSHPQTLTHDGANDSHPTWAPDATHLAFVSDRTGGGDIYTMKRDGRAVRRLTRRRGFEEDPAWSPDGRRLAYAVHAENHLEIHTVRADGRDDRMVVRSEDCARFTGHATWAPDGNRLAFSGCDGIDSEIYVVDTDGANLHAVTDTHVLESGPAWAPDGTIAFIRFGDIFTVDPDNPSHVSRITRTPADEFLLSWRGDNAIYFTAAGRR